MDKYIRTYAEINLDAIDYNFNNLKNCVNKNTKLCAVVKADGYGHGAVELSKFLESKVDYFAVATTDEAIELRNSNIKKPILILSYTHSDDNDILIENDISMTVFSLENAKKIQSSAKKLNKKALVHIAVDTGMSRIGFIPNDNSIKQIKEICKMPEISIQGIFSHYACADMKDKTTSELQTNRYKDFISKCKHDGINFPIKHICNSAGISEFSEHFDMVRMGISLYGLYPSDEIDKGKINLKPAMVLKSHITNIKEVPKGEGISYGHIYKTTDKRLIATVSAGYADGYPRALSNKGKVYVNGHFAPIVGRVCMDQFMIDISDIPNVNIDDEVILWGNNGIYAEEIGNESMSFNYEIVCGVSRRVPRVYKINNKTVSVKNYLR